MSYSQTSSATEQQQEELSQITEVTEILDSPLKTFLSINSNQNSQNYFSSFDISNRGLNSFTEISIKTSLNTLIATSNRLQNIQFQEKVMFNLKYLDISNNKITDIRCLAKITPNLEQFKATNNQIKEMVALPKVQYYNLEKNPIQIIEICIFSQNLMRLSFDWMVYLYPTQNISSDIDNLTKKLKQVFSSSKRQQFNQKFIRLDSFLEQTVSIHLFERKIQQFTFIAIKNNHSEFFDYIQKIFKDLRYLDEVKYESKTLFEHSLIHKCQRAQEYFINKVKFSRILKIYYLHIACRYNNLSLFNTLIEKGYSINSQDDKGNTLLHEIISNFNIKNSSPLFVSVVKQHQNPNKVNKRLLNPILYAANISMANTIQFLKYIQSNKHFLLLFNFDQISGFDYKENLLHLCVRLFSFEAINVIVENHIVNPFVINSMNKRARQMSSGITRKAIIKYQQKYFRKMGTRDRIKKSLFWSEDKTTQVCSHQNVEHKNTFWKQFLESEKNERTSILLKTVKQLEQVDCYPAVSESFYLNESLNSNHRHIAISYIENRLCSLNSSATGLFEQYNLFHHRLQLELLGDSKTSQNINSEVKFKIYHSEVTVGTVRNKEQRGPPSGYIEVMGRKLRCLNLSQT